MIMESRSKQIFQELDLKKIDSNNEAGHDQDSRSIDSSLEDSTNSVSSMSSSDLVEDASSSKSSSSSSSSSDGRLYELSELMAQLPIKKGLSEFYQGKSQSFASLANVKKIEDLVKKNKGSNNCYYYYKMKMKSCNKSYGHGLDINGHKSSSHSPKARATISKKSSIAARGSFLSSLAKTTS